MSIQPPHKSTSNRSSWTVVLIILGVIGLLGVLAVVSCGGCLFFAFRSLDDSISPAIDELFAAIDDGTFPGTYDTHLTPEFRQVTTREEYEDLGKTIKARLGSLKSRSLRQFNLTGSSAEVTYAASFEKGDGTISATLKKVGDRWLIMRFHVSSNVFQQDLATTTCRQCGEPHSASAMFCPKCGSPVNE